MFYEHALLISELKKLILTFSLKNWIRLWVKYKESAFFRKILTYLLNRYQGGGRSQPLVFSFLILYVIVINI